MYIIVLKIEKLIDINQSDINPYFSKYLGIVYRKVCLLCKSYNADLKLQYRGRLDESRKETSPAGVRRDLLEAMQQIAKTGQGPLEQIPSIGCSIKWKS